MHTPHFFFCFLAGGCESESSFVTVAAGRTEEAASSGVVGVVASVVVSDVDGDCGDSIPGFINDAIASVIPDELSGVEARATING